MSRVKTLSIAACSENLARVGAFVQASCEQHSKVILLDLAVTELVSNAIQHGQARLCKLTISRLADAYEICVQDDGQAFNPLEAPRLAMGELREGGYGLAIVLEIARLRYAHCDGWNRVILSVNAINL